MSQATAKKFKDALEAKGIDGVKIAGAKARDGSLKPILTEIANEAKIDVGYVAIVISELNKTSDKNGDAELAKKQKEVDAVLKAAREYREAAAKENKAALDTAYSTLQTALDKVAPDAGWNVPAGKDLVPQMDQLIKDIAGLSATVAAGNFESDYQLVTQISKGILRRAAIFLPGRLIGQRAIKPLYNFPASVAKSELAETNVFEQHFSSNSVFASYKNDLTQDGSATSVTAEAGAFFGFGAVAITGSYSGTSAAENSRRVNTLSETRQAVGVRVHCVHKASYDVQLEEVILNVPTTIDSVDVATDFLEAYGTHVITAPQILGGLYVLNSTVTFQKDVKTETYQEALSSSLRASESISGWGVTEVGIGKGSQAGAYDSNSTSAHAGGTTSSNDRYTASTSIDILGPSCLDAGAFRASLNNGNRSWAFINNGLSFDEKNRGEVVNQIAPVWKLFSLAGRHAEADLLRATWLHRVIETDAILDPHSFFSKLVHKTLNVDKLSADPADWAKVFVEKLALHRTPAALGLKQIGQSAKEYGYEEVKCRFLDRHAVGLAGTNNVLTRFQLQSEAKNIWYAFETATVTGSGVTLRTDETEAVTKTNLGADKECCYLDRHLVRGPSGTVLTGFHLQSDTTNIWYKYKYAHLYAGAVKFSYLEKDVTRSETKWDDGADKGVKYLDRQNINVPAGSLLVGFKLQRDAGNMNYEYWHVPASAFKAESLL